MSDKESLEKLLVYQQDLQTEKECLQKIISKLNAQAHALQVEQLHILNAINKTANTDKSGQKNSTATEDNFVKMESINPELQELDLSVPTFQSSEEDDDEIED
ncbi:PREDICTED: uncharacterized protein LOC105362806 [Ceratosolen solmsi marchali]|uniref:Uncharacterized protein LOC105362806 n=1 Tax=Ceratosolen solmsi marchali TaxID=326594 RepID=A0AAJ7DW49_9HYME|nr:PREDICTED: uncharacterized protein LOC105362806 [Ceratosolen solmsi marchali]